MVVVVSFVGHFEIIHQHRRRHFAHLQVSFSTLTPVSMPLLCQHVDAHGKRCQTQIKKGRTHCVLHQIGLLTKKEATDTESAHEECKSRCASLETENALLKTQVST